MYHLTTDSIGLSCLCKNAKGLYKVSYYVLSKAEAPKFSYFLLDPNHHFHCQNVSSKIKYNSKIALHTLTNFTFIHKPMTLLKLSDIKQKKLESDCSTLYNTTPKNIYRSIYLMYHKWQENTLFSTWCEICHESLYSPHFLLFKALFLSWKCRELFFFFKLPFSFI